MSLTVVSATMLAAMACKQLRKESVGSLKKDVAIMDEASRILDEGSLSKQRLRDWKSMQNDGVSPLEITQTSDASSFFCELASLAEEAVKSSIWCTCETSGSNSDTELFLECKHCRVTCCRNCVGAVAGYNLDSHNTHEINISVDEHRLGAFRSKLLTAAANKALVFNEDGIKEVASLAGNEDGFRVTGLSNYKFCFHDLKRGRKKWLIIYRAREQTAGAAVAEFQITVGELRTENLREGQEVGLGVKGELRSFFPAITTPLVFGALDPCAILTVRYGSLDCSWEGTVPGASTITLVVTGEGSEPSPRVELGLTDVASNSLKAAIATNHNKKWFNSAKQRGEARRWIYAENWKEWPKKITIEADGVSSPSIREAVKAIRGTYLRADCRQSTNMSALWIREDGDCSSPMTYILIHPNVK